MAQIPATGTATATTTRATTRAMPRMSGAVTFMVPAGMPTARWALSIGFTIKL